MAKSVKRADPVAMTADRSPKSPQPATVTNSDIAHHAYDLYLARCCEHGQDIDDWLQAERELQTSPAKA